MIRTQIQLEDTQAARLRSLAHERGVSMAALIREAVDRLLDQDPAPSAAQRRDRILALAGRYDSGASDVSERHDDYLAEAIASSWRPS